MIQRIVLGLIALGAMAWADYSAACERPGGSAANAQRPSYGVPRINYAQTMRPYYPPPLYGNPANYGVNPNYGNNPNYQPVAAYGQDASGGYQMTPTAPVASMSQSAAPKQPARIVAPSLPQQQETVALPVGTNRMRYVALTVTGMTGADAANQLEQELGKLAGVRGVNVKTGKGPTTVKVWFSDKEPVGAADVLAEVQKLGFQAAVAEGT